MPIDISPVVNKYKGMWVAYKNDRKTVVASGKTAKTALERAKISGYRNPILARIPTRVMGYRIQTYQHRWVALDADYQVIDSADHLTDLINTLSPEQQTEQPTFLQVLPHI